MGSFINFEMNALQVNEVDNEVLNDADQHLREHKILELFEDLTTLLAYKQPDNLEGFLVQQIEARVKNGTRSIVYTEAEMQNIFTLYDLKNSGHITKEQCRKALTTLANSEFHFTRAQEASIPTKVDMFTFMKICDDILNIKPN